MADQKHTMHESAIGWMILAGIAFAVGFLLWMNFEYQLKDMLRWIRVGEMNLVALFVDEQYKTYANGQPVLLEASIRDIKALDPSQLHGPVLGIVSEIALRPMQMPVAILLGLMGFWALLFGPGTQYRRKLNIDGLIGAQSGTFPAIQPFVKFNPSTMPPRPPGSPVPAELPPFAEALGPEEWISYNQIPVPDGRLDDDAAYVAFAKQLGPRWQGPMNLPPYKQILLAAFCLKAARKRSDADAMLGRLAACWSHEKSFQIGKDGKLLREARSILKNKDIAGGTLAKCNQHAFQTTALLRGLQSAREEGGVLAPAQFVWLRAFDRNLWYPLNNLGRQAYHMEALGAMAHYKGERLTQRPIPKPKLDNAIKSITDYMNSPRARPIPQLDYGKSKKRGIKQPKTAKKKKK